MTVLRSSELGRCAILSRKASAQITVKNSYFLLRSLMCCILSKELFEELVFICDSLIRKVVNILESLENEVFKN